MARELISTDLLFRTTFEIGLYNNNKTVWGSGKFNLFGQGCSKTVSSPKKSQMKSKFIFYVTQSN